MILRTLTVGQLHTNCYLVVDENTQEGFLVDPGGDEGLILSEIKALGAKLKLILLTHFHFDHILAAEPVRKATGAVLAIHRVEADQLTEPPALFRFFAPKTPRGLVADRLLDDGDWLEAGGLKIEVLGTPGHSPGGASFWLAEHKVVFCGDALFRQGIGRTDFPGSDQETLFHSIRERLFSLPDDTTVYPGHGPRTTIGYERRHNPWVGPAR